MSELLYQCTHIAIHDGVNIREIAEIISVQHRGVPWLQVSDRIVHNECRPFWADPTVSLFDRKSFSTKFV